MAHIMLGIRRPGFSCLSSSGKVKSSRGSFFKAYTPEASVESEKAYMNCLGRGWPPQSSDPEKSHTFLKEGTC